MESWRRRVGGDVEPKLPKTGDVTDRAQARAPTSVGERRWEGGLGRE